MVVFTNTILFLWHVFNFVFVVCIGISIISLYYYCDLSIFMSSSWHWVLLVIIIIVCLINYIYSPTKVKHHLTCFNNNFSYNELISNRFAIFVTCTHILTYLWNRLLIDFYLCVYDRVCKVPRVLFNICVCERKLIFLCRILSCIFYWFGMVRQNITIP